MVTEARTEREALEKLQLASEKLFGIQNSGLVLDGSTIRLCLLSEEPWLRPPGLAAPYDW